MKCQDQNILFKDFCKDRFIETHTVTDFPHTLRDNIGFPIVEFDDGSHDQFVLTKPPQTGGEVSFATAAEQARRNNDRIVYNLCLVVV